MTAMDTHSRHRRVGVVGIDCVFPGASGREQFWELLVRGEHGISEIPSTRWLVPDAPGSVPPAGYIDDPAGFDCSFFGINPTEASGMDVQQRLVLEAAWRACEDAGIAPASLAGTSTGVYAGVMSSDWTALNVADPAAMSPHLGAGSGQCMIANRVSYHLDLRGPSMSVDTACSSSLVAFYLAAQAIRAGDCDVALVAGVNVMLSPALPAFYSSTGLSAPDGRSKPFSAGANGIGRGEGVGVVVLRVLDDQVEASGTVYAEVLGGRVGHDGRSNGLTAPSKWAQVDVLRRALDAGDVCAGDVDFLEAHGTGTTLGDMIEANALGEVFSGRAAPCLMGSVKGNVGHLEGAAGIAGAIKACLALEHRILPPSLFAVDENPKLGLADKGLSLATGPTRLPARAIAGVSSFGMGGTDVHMLLRGVPTPRLRPSGSSIGVVTVSAATPAALSVNIARVAEYLDGVSDSDFARVSRGTNLVKSDRRVRLAVAAPDRRTAVAQLRTRLRDHVASGLPPNRVRPRVAFLFTGQGSLTAGVARRLASSIPAVRTHVDRALTLFPDDVAATVEQLLLGPPTEETVRVVETDSASSQPAMFVLQYALTGAYSDLGIRPAAVLGHSIGEIAAATITGALPPEAAAELVLARGRAMRDLPETGAMSSVEMSVDAAREWIGSRTDVVIAADNGPARVVLAGTGAAIEEAERALDGRSPRRLAVTHAFHSPLVAGAGAAFARSMEGRIGRGVPGIPFFSTLRGAKIAEALDLVYWSEQISAPVQFRTALAELLATEPTHLLEIGPRAVLTSLAAEQGGARITRLAPLDGERSTGIEFAYSVARLYEDGADVRWDGLYRPEDVVPVRMPVYEFDHDQHVLPLYPGGRLPQSRGPEVSEDDRSARDTSVEQVVPPSATGISRDDSPEPVGVVSIDTRDIALIVRETIGEISGYATSVIEEGARLREDLGFDSILAMQLADRLAERVRFDEPPEITEFVESLVTVDTLIEFAVRRSEGKR